MDRELHLAPGTVFARDFRVVSLLAEGGMGAVYVVEQLSTGKHRALKVMHPQLVSDGRTRVRFAQEAQISGRIESDHVVEVIASGVDEPTGVPWLAMELLRGRTLTDYMQERGTLRPAEALEVFRQLCHALGAAHSIGLVHRDMKPDNVFLAVPMRPDVRFTVKVLDFGIAKWVQDSRTAAANSQMIGTPLWMAPEQVETGMPIRPATDVWALGLMAFFMLTGRLYWHTANAGRLVLHAILSEMMIRPLVPASQRASELGAAGLIPPGFDAWFARCVTRNVGERFRGAGELGAALVPVLEAASSAAASRGGAVGAASVAQAAPLWMLPTATPAGLAGPVGEPSSSPRVPIQPTVVGAPEGAAAAERPSKPDASGAEIPRTMDLSSVSRADAAALQAMAQQHAAAGDPRRAIERWRALLSTDPTDAQALAALFDAYGQLGARDAAYCVGRAICAQLGEQAPANVRAFVEAEAAHAPAAPTGTLAAARFASDVLHPGCDPALTRALTLALPALQRMQARPLEDLGAGADDDRLDVRQSAHPAARALGAAFRALDVVAPPVVLVRPGDPGWLTPAGTEPPALIVGAGLLAADAPAALAFAAGRAGAYCRPELHARVLLPAARALSHVLAAALHAALPAFEVPPDVATTARSLAEAFARDAVDVPALADAARSFREHGGAHAALERWFAAAELSACRAGILLGGDLTAARLALAGTRAAMGDAPAAERDRELLAFAISEGYFQLRDELGLSLKG